MYKITLDLKNLLKPIAKTMPVGKNLRVDSDTSSKYYQIKDARMAARVAERKYFEEPNESLLKNSRALWQTVSTLSLDILENLSKDLEVLTWFIEALLRHNNFYGLAQGFELAYGLIEKYWPTIYPVADEEGPTSKLIALASLNGLDSEGALETPIHCIPITDAQKTESYALWQYKQALDAERIDDQNKKQKKYSQGVIPLEMIKNAALQSGNKFYKKLQSDIDMARKAYLELCLLIENHCGYPQFPSTNLIRIFDETYDLINYLSGHKKEVVLTLPPKKMQSFVSSTVNNNFRNREEALHHLLIIADYFRNTEPQSLLPYILERANRWGKLSLPALLEEIVSNESARQEVFNLTGLNNLSI